MPPTGALQHAFAAPGLVALIALVLRAVSSNSAYDVHVDELIYLNIAENVAQHLRVDFYADPFYLHPPAYFFIEASYLKLFAPAGNAVDVVQAVRHLNVYFGAATAGLLVVIGRTVAGRRVGVAGGLLFALDPFAIRMNTLALLDTSAIFWVVLGYSLLFTATADEIRTPRDTRLRHASAGAVRAPTPAGLLSPCGRRAGAAGVAWGVAVLTKDLTVLMTLLPLGWCFLRRHCLPRRTILIIGLITSVFYATYLLLVLTVGHPDAFVDQKLHGLLRLIGRVQETGFNQKGGPSLVTAIRNQLDQFATTYTVLGLGVVAVVVLIRHASSRRRLLAVWTAGAYVLLAYSVTKGTLEEQFFYYLVVPAFLASACAAGVLLRAARSARRRRVIVLGLAGLLVPFVLWSSFVWVRVHTRQDNGYERLVSYFRGHVPPRTPVTVSTVTADILLGARYETRPWRSISALRAENSKDVIVATKLVQNGYGPVYEEDYRWLRDHARRMFAFSGFSYGTLEVYRLRDHPQATRGVRVRPNTPTNRSRHRR